MHIPSTRAEVEAGVRTAVAAVVCPVHGGTLVGLRFDWSVNGELTARHAACCPAQDQLLGEALLKYLRTVQN